MTSTDIVAPARSAQYRAAHAAALDTVRANITSFRAGYPDDTTVAGVYRLRTARDGFDVGANVGWTTSFWPGMLWLAYEATGADEFRHAGQAGVDDFAARVARRQDLETHDLGFLYTLSCVAPWRLIGGETARAAAVDAAGHLMRRFLEPAGIIQAWGDLSDPEQRGRTIVDSLMNTPLLYWAGARTGDGRFRDAAVRHTRALRDHIIRADDSTFHTFYWDVHTGAPLGGATQQGHSDASCWARGQAWGIYGFALNHRHTGDPTFLDAARRCADHFLAHLPADGVVFWDLVFSDGSDEPRDSSAAAIAVCGLFELAAADSDAAHSDGADRYASAAHRILRGLIEGYTSAPGPGPLLLHAVYDIPKRVGVDEGCLWGDYFYLEALTRVLRPGWQPYW